MICAKANSNILYWQFLLCYATSEQHNYKIRSKKIRNSLLRVHHLF